MRCTTNSGCRRYNLFQPLLHQVSKEVVNGKLKRRWDTAQTPYQRLLASGVLAPEQETRLAQLYAATNPRQLRAAIYAAIGRLWQPADQRKEAAVSGNSSK